MDGRRSSNQQDTADSTAEMAVQIRPRRSTVKSLEVRAVSPNTIRPLIEERHYLRSMPAVSKLCFGVYLRDALEGAVVFTSGPRHGHRLLQAAKPQDVSVLARLWLSDNLPKNSESRVIGVVLRIIRKSTSWKVLISYADPNAGHLGTIYQATGWYYLGQTEANSYIELDGDTYHPRTIYNRYGSNSLTHLRATGIAATRFAMRGKHRYVYVLNPGWRWRLCHKVQPYPREEVR
jgi:hypothetical protein